MGAAYRRHAYSEKAAAGRKVSLASLLRRRRSSERSAEEATEKTAPEPEIRAQSSTAPPPWSCPSCQRTYESGASAGCPCCTADHAPSLERPAKQRRIPPQTSESVQQRHASAELEQQQAAREGLRCRHAAAELEHEQAALEGLRAAEGDTAFLRNSGPASTQPKVLRESASAVTPTTVKTACFDLPEDLDEIDKELDREEREAEEAERAEEEERRRQQLQWGQPLLSRPHSQQGRQAHLSQPGRQHQGRSAPLYNTQQRGAAPSFGLNPNGIEGVRQIQAKSRAPGSERWAPTEDANGNYEFLPITGRRWSDFQDSAVSRSISDSALLGITAPPPPSMDRFASPPLCPQQHLAQPRARNLGAQPNRRQPPRPQGTDPSLTCPAPPPLANPALLSYGM